VGGDPELARLATRAEIAKMLYDLMEKKS